MPDKAPTYRIDESLLRSKLLGYEVELNTSRCGAIEEEVAAMRLKKSIELPKVNVRVLGAVLLVLVFVTAVAYNFDSIKGIFSSGADAEAKTVQENKAHALSNPGSQPAGNSAVITQTIAAGAPAAAVTENVTIPPPVNNASQPVQQVLKKTDTVVSDKKTDTIAGDKASKASASPVVAGPPSDSAAKVNTESKADPAVQVQDPPVKKKKRRRRNANMEELKQSTLESNGSDDDVVVPQ